jgi:aspartate aminotransferase-like enzyme
MHGEGSTGVLQPLDGIGGACRRAGALLLVDASFTLSGVDLRTTAWEVDAAWSGTQRCLSAIAGLTLVALGPRALKRLVPSPSSALHLSRALTGDYETFPAPLLYALVEVLQLCSDQGLPYRFSRHRNRQEALIAGLQAMALEIVAAPAARLPSVTVVRVPAGVDGEAVRRALLSRFRLEIGGPVDAALGPVWRIGVMGHSAAPANILLLCSALEVLLEEQGCHVQRGAAARAALAVMEW